MRTKKTNFRWHRHRHRHSETDIETQTHPRRFTTHTHTVKNQLEGANFFRKKLPRNDVYVVEEEDTQTDKKGNEDTKEAKGQNEER